MPLYTPGRRRAILLLLLTSVLLLTLDLRGNAIFDGVRTGFNKFMEPLESAADVATRPISNAWHGIEDYQALLATNDLPALADYPTVTAMVVGVSPSNLDQIVEINKGRKDGLQVGMAVTTSAGLVGKITTPLLEDRARVMLITDPRYVVPVKVVPGAPPETTTTTTTVPPSTEPGASVPPASVPGTAPSESVPPSSSPPSSAPAPEGALPPETVPGETTTTTTPPTTTTSVPDDRPRDTGKFSGQGAESLPQVDLLDDTPMFG